jgi:hypothetical protein
MTWTGNVNFDFNMPPPMPVPAPDPAAQQAPPAAPPVAAVSWPPPPPVVTSKAVQLQCDFTIVGIPEPQEWTRNMTTDDLLVAAGALQVKSQEIQLDTAKKNLDAAQSKQSSENSKSLKQHDEWVKKAAEARRKRNSLGSQISKWAMRIAAPLAVVASTAATVATAGGATPLLVLSIAMCAYTLAQQASAEAGGPSLSIADRLHQGFTELLMKCNGMSKEDAEKHGGVLAGFVGGAFAVLDPKAAVLYRGSVAQELGASKATADMVNRVVTMVAQIAVQIAMMKCAGGSKSANLSAEALKWVQRGHIVAGFAQNVQSCATVSQAALAIDTAQAQNDADLARADMKRTEAVELKLQDQTQSGIEDYKEFVEQIAAAFTWISEALQKLNGNRAHLTANIVSPNA